MSRFDDLNTVVTADAQAIKFAEVEEARPAVITPNLNPPQRPVEMVATNVRMFGEKLIPVMADLANRNVYPKTDS